MINFKIEYKVNDKLKSLTTEIPEDHVEDRLSLWIIPFFKKEITDLKIWNLQSGLFLDYNKV